MTLHQSPGRMSPFYGWSSGPAAPAGAVSHWLQTFLCSREREEMDLRKSAWEWVSRDGGFMVCLCSLQTAKCTQCSGQDRESGTWKRAVFLILGHLEWGLGTHTGSSSHGDGVAFLLHPQQGTLLAYWPCREPLFFVLLWSGWLWLFSNLVTHLMTWLEKNTLVWTEGCLRGIRLP